MVTRHLTDGEKDLVTNAYGNNIDVEKLRITNEDIVPFQKNYSVTPFNTIHLADALASTPDLSVKDVTQAHLIHESWHAYEWQTQGFGTVIKSIVEQIGDLLGLRNAYDLTEVSASSDFSSLSNEQQARLMEVRHLYSTGLTQEEVIAKIGGVIPPQSIVDALTATAFEQFTQNATTQIGTIGGALKAAGEAIGGVLGSVFDPVASALDAIFHPNGYQKKQVEPTSKYSASNKSLEKADKNKDGKLDGHEKDDFRAHEEERFDKQRAEAKDNKDKGTEPILLDLDGNGVTINELSRSGVFKDAGGDGLQHRTAWAGAGDGVLFFDADGDGTLSQKREYVFTEWDPTAATDMEALRAYFDTNGDGKLTSADTGFAQFKVLVTNADGGRRSRR